MAFSNNQGGDESPPMAEINIIPLVDVMLVLLIIAMVTSPFLEQGVNVDLPAANGQNLQRDEIEAPIVMYLAKDLTVRIGEKPVLLADLKEELGVIFGKRQSKEIFVRADKEVPYGVVAEIMARVQQSGIDRVRLVTKPQ